MIRIDLGRGDSPRGGGGGLGKLLDKLKIKLPGGRSFGGGGGGRGSKLAGDVKGLLIIGVTVAISCLPHLFFTQFRTYVIEQHQARVKKLEESIGVLNQEIEKLTPFQKELESYEQQKRLVKDRLQIVRDLLQNRGTPVNILDAVGQSLPTRAWVTNLDLTWQGGAGTIRMQGQAYTNEDISDFLDKLSESVHLAEVKLEDVGSGKTDKIDVRTFRVSAQPKIKIGPRRVATPPGGGAPAGNPPAGPNGGAPPQGGAQPGAEPAPGGKI